MQQQPVVKPPIKRKPPTKRQIEASLQRLLAHFAGATVARLEVTPAQKK